MPWVDLSKLLLQALQVANNTSTDSTQAISAMDVSMLCGYEQNGHQPMDGSSTCHVEDVDHVSPVASCNCRAAGVMVFVVPANIGSTGCPADAAILPAYEMQLEALADVGIGYVEWDSEGYAADLGQAVTGDTAVGHFLEISIGQQQDDEPAGCGSDCSNGTEEDDELQNSTLLYHAQAVVDADLVSYATQQQLARKSRADVWFARLLLAAWVTVLQVCAVMLTTFASS